MTIDMMSIITDLAYPRLSGTDNDEKKCKHYLIQKFESLGVKPVVDTFPFSEFATNVLLRLVVTIILSGMIAGLLLEWFDQPIINLILIISLIASMVFAISMQRTKLDSFAVMGKMKETFNIHATIPATGQAGLENGIKNILFVGHHDTKSQKVTTLIRTASYMFGIIFSLAIGLLFILSAILKLAGVGVTTPDLLLGLRWSATIIFCIDIMFLCILIYNRTVEGKSLGSIDNATAVSIVLKLLEEYKKNPPRNVNLWFVITGAEEWGMVGAVAFWKKYATEMGSLSSNDTAVFNYDAVAGGLHYLEHLGITGKKEYAPILNPLLKKAADESGIIVTGFRLPVPMGTTDGWVFHSHGVKTIDIINEGMAKYMHSGKDTPDKCDLKTMEDAVTVTKKAVELLGVK